MNNKDFVHIHTHSEYSQFDGLSKMYDLVMKSREMGCPALAITDHGTLGGALKLQDLCNKTNDKKGQSIEFDKIKPIIGCEVYMSRDHKARSKDEQPNGPKGNYHLILLAKNWQGYKNLCHLSHTAHIDGFYMKPRIDMDLLDEYSEGLICSSACLQGVINQNLLYDRYDVAKKCAVMFKDIFGEDFFLEVMYHGIPEEKVIISDIFKLGKELDIPIIATNDSHYITKDQAKSQEILMCMSTQNTIVNPKHIRFPYAEFYLKSADEMCVMFGGHKEAITNTVALAERIDSKDIQHNMFGSMRLPIYEVPVEYNDPQEYLTRLAWDGMKRLGWNKSQKHIDALNKELEDIRIAKENNNYDFATYFLIVWDYMNFAKKNGIITGSGRGSGYASILLRCLGVCYGPDPIEYGLLWERFLGFDEKQFILESDFGFTDKLDTELAKFEDAEDAYKKIITIVLDKHNNETELSKIHNEIKIMSETDGLDGKPILNQFLNIVKTFHGKSDGADKNHINSYTAYAIGLTSQEPEGEFLPFRRAFARAGFPDIDSDFDFFRRDEVYNYIIDKYGRENVSNTGTYASLKLRSAMTRTIKALDIAGSWHKSKPEFVTDNMRKVTEILDQLPDIVNGKMKSKDENGEDVEIKTITDAYKYCDNFKFYLDKYDGLYRHATDVEGVLSSFGVHPAGIVVANEPLCNIAPSRRAKKDQYASQYIYEDLESMGLIKFDILAIASLTAIDRTVKMIKDNYNIDIDIENLPLEDKATLALYRSGKLTGVFQCENGGMQKTMREIGVDRFYDVVAAIALFRPGPMASIPEYCARKNGQSQVNYFHPSIEQYVKPYLEKTYGILVFQEQVMQICNILAGFSISDAYVVIKAVGKKKVDLLTKFRKHFISGCISNGVPQDVAEQYWDKFITPFAEYGFNIAHSLCYAYTSWMCAYLKAHYPEEFILCSLNVRNERRKMPDVEDVLRDMKNFNMVLGEKNINTCGPSFRIITKRDANAGIDKTVIAPSLMVKGIKEEKANHIASNAPYKDLTDLVKKTKSEFVNSDVISSLVEEGFMKEMISNESKKVKGRLTKEGFIEMYSVIKKDIGKASAKGVESVDIFE